MKPTIPLRVSPELRQQAVLERGDAVLDFAPDAFPRSIEFRKSRQVFISRGLAGAVQAGETGKYVPAERVIRKLEQKLRKAKKRAA